MVYVTKNGIAKNFRYSFTVARAIMSIITVRNGKITSFSNIQSVK